MKTSFVSVRRWTAFAALTLVAMAGASINSVARAKTTKVPVYEAAEIPAGPPVLGSSFAPIVKRDQPAVVNISSSKLVRSPGGEFLGPTPFFQQFFGDDLGNVRVPREQMEHSLGSGVIVSPEGYLLTNNHVVDGAAEIKVTLSDKREFRAKVVGTDPQTDIAVLKVDAQNLPSIPFGDSSRVEVGDVVLALGNPFGVGQTVTMGITSATGRGNLGIEDYESFIQTDAAINPGNSGGALVNSRGELIGINTAIISGESGGNQGVGFAVPVNLARNVMDQILQNGKVTRAWLGVMLQEVTPSLAKAFSLAKPQGALIGDVTPGSPASRAGLRTGDILQEVNGKPVTDVSQLRIDISMMKPGTSATLGIVRDGSKLNMPVILGELPGDISSYEGDTVNHSSAVDGLHVQDLTSEIAGELRLPPGTHGVVVSGLDSASPAAEAGLERGDVIEEVNRKPVSSVREFEQAVRASRNQAVLLLVNRQGRTHYVVLEGR